MKFIHLALSLKSNLKSLVSVFFYSLKVTAIFTAFVLKPSLGLASDSETAIDKIKKFEKAVFYLAHRDYLQAGKLFEEVAADAMFPNVIRNTAQQELTKIKNSLTDQYLNKKIYNFYILIVLCYQNLAEVAPDKMLGFFKEFPEVKSIFFDTFNLFQGLHQ